MVETVSVHQKMFFCYVGTSELTNWGMRMLKWHLFRLTVAK